MSGATSNASISSLVNQCQTMEELTQGALIKAFRAATGQFSTSDLTVNNSASLTLAANQAVFSFPVKANAKYIWYFDLLFNVWAAAGPLGNLLVKFNLPAHTTNYSLNGQALYTISGSAGSIIQLGNAANSPYASVQVPSVQGINSSIVSANTATAAYSASLFGQAMLTPAVDDVLTLSVAQAAASATGSTVLQTGSSMNLLCLSSSRRAPNVV